MFIFIFTLFCIYHLIGFYIFISIERANGEQWIFHELAGWFWPVGLISIFLYKIIKKLLTIGSRTMLINWIKNVCFGKIYKTHQLFTSLLRG